MKIKTQIIDKIEDVKAGDIAVIDNDRTSIVDVYSINSFLCEDGYSYGIDECTIVRLTLEEG
tara:strand:+ start:2763 stop:2948 length:186 start_codon:yes stop_codon:yes gene_type:complete